MSHVNASLPVQALNCSLIINDLNFYGPIKASLTTLAVKLLKHQLVKC